MAHQQQQQRKRRRKHATRSLPADAPYAYCAHKSLNVISLRRVIASERAPGALHVPGPMSGVAVAAAVALLLVVSAFSARVLLR